MLLKKQIKIIFFIKLIYQSSFVIGCRKELKKQKEPNTESDWKKDDGEYACSIWKWWRPRVEYFPCFSLALRLVVLTQLSSCFVERVFSCLKLIKNPCGGGMLEDHLEMRLFIQCNGDLNELVKH